MFEMRQETDYVRHHQHKVAAFFCRNAGFADVVGTMADILYVRLDSPKNQQNSSTKNLAKTAKALPQLEKFLFSAAR